MADKARLFWRKYGVLRSDSEQDDQYFREPTDLELFWHINAVYVFSCFKTEKYEMLFVSCCKTSNEKTLPYFSKVRKFCFFMKRIQLDIDKKQKGLDRFVQHR